jgi:DNA polymerase III delta prime subunit
MPFGDFKVVLLDEADYISSNGQAALRGVMEHYHASARFILTCNYPNRIIPALHSRCQGFHIAKVDQVEFTARIAEILIAEKIVFDIDTLDTYVKSTYPDLRKCINNCQMNSTSGVLESPHGDEDSSTADYKLAVVELFKKKQYSKGREKLCASVRPENMEEIYRWFYDNLDFWGDTDEEKDAAILKIRTGLVNHSFVSDPEINLAACIIELTQG